MPREMRGLCRVQAGAGKAEREKEESGRRTGHRNSGTGTDAEHKEQEVKEMAFVAEFVRKDGTRDRHTFRNCMEYANYIEKENLEHWREDDGKFIVSASGALVAVDEIRQGRE